MYIIVFREGTLSVWFLLYLCRSSTTDGLPSSFISAELRTLSPSGVG